MSFEITEHDVAALETHHGDGMVVVLSVGPEEFAFRRPSKSDVNLTVDALDRSDHAAHEQCAVRCLLVAAQPDVNPALNDAPRKPGEKAQKLTIPPILVQERERLATALAQASIYGDWLGLGLAEASGWHWQIDVEPLGGGCYEIKACSDHSGSVTNPGESAIMEARKLSPGEYAIYKRRRLTDEIEADRYLYSVAVQSANKADVAKRYPYLVVALRTTLQTLGAEVGSVNVKKFRSGSANTPGPSGEQPVEAQTSE